MSEIKDLNEADVEVMFWTTKQEPNEDAPVRRLKHVPTGALVDFGDHKVKKDEAMKVLKATVHALMEE